MLKTIAVWAGSIKLPDLRPDPTHPNPRPWLLKAQFWKNHDKRAIRDPTWCLTKITGSTYSNSNERTYAKLALAMGSGTRTWDKGVSDAARNVLCPKCALELASIQKTKQRKGFILILMFKIYVK